jgi:dehydrogenase/reductase SDR family protein 7B
MKYKGKTVWITGAASGIGEALAYEYSKGGAIVILSDINKEKLKEVAAECERNGGKACLAPFNLENSEEIVSVSNDILKQYPKIDYLYNNGGISQRSYAVETPVAIDRKIMETNFFGAVTITKQLLPSLISKGGGHIIVTSSVVGKFGFPLRTAYSASKHALQGFFEALRAELYDKNVKVTIVSPGKIRTNISVNAINKDGSRHGVMDERQAKGMPADICARRIISAVNRNKKELWFAGREVLMVYVRLYLPWLFHRLAPKVNPV